jgi:hypothetical protein
MKADYRYRGLNDCTNQNMKKYNYKFGKFLIQSIKY